MLSPMDNAFALLVGIADYQKIGKLPVTPVHNDVEAIRQALIDPALCGYKPGNVEVLLDEQATRQGILDGFRRLKERGNAESSVVLYFSCHGGRVDQGEGADKIKVEYLLPVDVDYSSLARLQETAISADQFAEAWRKLPSRRVLALLDCCHASGIVKSGDERQIQSDVLAEIPLPQPEPKAGEGQSKFHAAARMLERVALRRGLPDRFYDTLVQGAGRVVISACRADEESLILGGDANSLFTKHIVAGLRGGAPERDGFIRVFELYNYIEPLVRKEADKISWSQSPVFEARSLETNFPVALWHAGKSAAAFPIAAEGVPVPPPPATFSELVKRVPPLSQANLRKLAIALLKTKAIKDPLRRSMLIDFLPEDIRILIPQSPVPVVEVEGIILTCLDVDYGFKNFIDAVRISESATQPREDLDELLLKLYPTLPF